MQELGCSCRLSSQFLKLPDVVVVVAPLSRLQDGHVHAGARMQSLSGLIILGEGNDVQGPSGWSAVWIMLCFR